MHVLGLAQVECGLAMFRPLVSTAQILVLGQVVFDTALHSCAFCAPCQAVFFCARSEKRLFYSFLVLLMDLRADAALHACCRHFSKVSTALKQERTEQLSTPEEENLGCLCRDIDRGQG